MTSTTIAVVNYNTREHLHSCLATVTTQGADQIIIVDNASTDGSAELIQREYGHLSLVLNSTNHGFGAAANQAFAISTCDYVLLLNSDTLLESDALKRLSSYLSDHPAAAVVGPRLQNPDGTLQPSAYPFPALWDMLIEVSSFDRALRHLPFLRERYLRTWDHDAVRPVPWILGAVMLIRRSAFVAIGGFDESYFMYFEEVDLCYRLRSAGWHVCFAPVTTVVHIHGASTIQHRADMLLQGFHSMKRFYSTNYGAVRRFRLDLLISAILTARIVRDTARVRLRPDLPHVSRLLEDLVIWRSALRQQWEKQ